MHAQGAVRSLHQPEDGDRGVELQQMDARKASATHISTDLRAGLPDRIPLKPHI